MTFRVPVHYCKHQHCPSPQVQSWHARTVSHDMHEVCKILVSINVTQQCKSDDFFFTILLISLLIYLEYLSIWVVALSIQIYRTLSPMRSQVLPDKLKIYRRYPAVRRLSPQGSPQTPVFYCAPPLSVQKFLDPPLH